MTRRRRPRTAQERVIGVLGTVAPGSLGGRIRNTRPASVVQPNTGGPPDTGPGFDPNENPIIIGLGATAGGTSTPDDVSTGALGAVVIGWGAYADGQYDVALGFGATVDGVVQYATAIGAQSTVEGTEGIAIGHFAYAQLADAPIAIGRHASVSADRGIAVGSYAEADGISSVAVGDSAWAANPSSTAVGAGANANHDDATAVGQGAHTSKAHQIKLGRGKNGTDPGTFVEIAGVGPANGIVLTDTADGTRYIAQITSAAWVFSAAP